MKRLFISFALIVLIAITTMAQTTTKIKVAGNCGMCKKNIETAAKTAGASTAAWDKTTKVLTLGFDAALTSTDKIEAAITEAGYDTEHQTASQEAYSKLDECCQYDRTSKVATKTTIAGAKDMACCKDGACTKDGKNCCKKDAACCKKGMATAKKGMTAACCKDASCCKKA
jgi:mercuric ion binding protein